MLLRRRVPRSTGGQSTHSDARLSARAGGAFRERAALSIPYSYRRMPQDFVVARMSGMAYGSRLNWSEMIETAILFVGLALALVGVVFVVIARVRVYRSKPVGVMLPP